MAKRRTKPFQRFMDTTLAPVAFEGQWKMGPLTYEQWTKLSPAVQLVIGSYIEIAVEHVARIERVAPHG